MKQFKGPPWPEHRLTLEEQKAVLGSHWRGAPGYVPSKAQRHPYGSYFMEQVAKKAAEQGRHGIY
ncbi:MAG: hypothetical protein IKI90_03300 [Treponema sp.]|nr:hypothetical protein [Treponema sp.]